jgi:osmotically-inducible protein OsmY
MTRKLRGSVVCTCTLGLLAVAWAAAAQEPKKGTGELLKEKVGGAVQSVKKGAAAAEHAVQEQYERAKSSVHSMGVEARVYGRLHWDKALQGAKIDMKVKDGVVTLHGTVADAKAKVKAVELTMDTVGVTQVVDQLTALAGTPEPAKASARP